MPTEALQAIATSTDEEYQSNLQNLLRTSYAEVFEVLDPAQDAQDRFINFFRRYTPASQRKRMVTFFLGICRESGIQVLEAPKPKRRSASGKPRAKAKRKPTGSQPRPAVFQNDPVQRQSGSVPAPIRMLMEALPPEGEPLSPARRDQWLALARQALAFVYPEGPNPAMHDEIGGDDRNDFSSEQDQGAQL